MATGISVVMMTNDYARCRQVGGRYFQMFRAPSGADDRGRWRIEVPVGVDDHLGTKKAHSQNDDDALECLHLAVPTLAGPTSRPRTKEAMRGSLRNLQSPLFGETRLEKRIDR
jgi:hypothetical protein